MGRAADGIKAPKQVDNLPNAVRAPRLRRFCCVATLRACGAARIADGHPGG
jgi:hypothetical protein